MKIKNFQINSKDLFSEKELSENIRIKFSKDEARSFFVDLKADLKCKTFRELSEKLEVPYGRLKLYLEASRTLPAKDFQKWRSKYKLKTRETNFRVIDLKQVLEKARKAGFAATKNKYGSNWSKILGKKGKASLDKKFEEDRGLYDKWRSSISTKLLEKYGKDAYRIIGSKGGTSTVNKYGKEVLRSRLKEMFPKSINKRILYNDFRLRSNKELEVASLLDAYKIQYSYEKHILSYFPDFVLSDNKTIIEVVGFDWKNHVERTVSKIVTLINNGYTVIVYTYPNLMNRFKDLPVLTAIDKAGLIKILVDHGHRFPHPGRNSSLSFQKKG